MQYMIIERFHPGKLRAMYERFEQKGRMLPEGVKYINSWMKQDLSICYQLMEAEDEGKLQDWTHCWNDLVDFEVIPVISSAEAKWKALG